MSDTANRDSTLIDSHTPSAVRARLRDGPEPQSYLKDFVYGSIDGTVTTFAIVAGVVGAGLQAPIVLTLGLANLLADGFSMAASNFLGCRTDNHAKERTRVEEQRQIQFHPEGEREEVRQIYAEKGFGGEDLERIVKTITADEERWLKTMMIEEHGYPTNDPVPWRAALSTFLAFVAVGSVPLLSYLINFLAPGSISNPFVWSSVLTAVAFLLVGTIKGRVSPHHWWLSTLETLAVGGIAACIAYFVGAFLRSIGVSS